MFLLFIPCVLSLQTGAFANVIAGPDVCSPTGQTSRLLCEDSTVESHTFEWIKGSDTGTGKTVILVRESGTISNRDGFDRHSIEDGTTLVITASQINDSDTYWCNIGGPSGASGSDSLTLSVLDVPTEASLQLESPLTESTEGDTVLTNITCETPPQQLTTTYEWEKDGETIDDTTEGVAFYESEKVLSLTNISRTSAGNYTCIAKNCAGHVRSDEKELLVEYIPKVQSISDDTSALTFKKQDLKLTVETEGYPVPSITWSNKAGPLTQTSSIIIVKADRMYESINCTVCNKLGCDTQVITVSILDITLEGFILAIVIPVSAICVIIIVVVLYKKKFGNREENQDIVNKDRSKETNRPEKNGDKSVEMNDHLA